MFCVRCGREVGDAPLVGGLCETCYLEEHALVALPEAVDVERCVHCGARKRGEIWVELGEPVEATLAAAVREAVRLDRRVGDANVRVELVPQDERNFVAVARVSGIAEGFRFDREVRAKARLKGGTCLRCSRITGGYFEATLQVRAKGRDMTRDEVRRTRALCSRIIDRIVAEGDRNAFVLKDQEIHGGLDVVVGTTSAARMMAKAILQEFGATLTESSRLAGRKDGNDLYRLTFAMRLPEYAAGDAVVLRDDVRIVQSIGPKHVTLRDPTTGRASTAEREDVDRAVVLPRASAREAVVVSATAAELQVLDPWTLETVPLVRPAGMAVAPPTLDVLRWEEELVPLPPLHEG